MAIDQYNTFPYGSLNSTPFWQGHPGGVQSLIRQGDGGRSGSNQGFAPQFNQGMLDNYAQSLYGSNAGGAVTSFSANPIAPNYFGGTNIGQMSMLQNQIAQHLGQRPANQASNPNWTSNPISASYRRFMS